MHTSEGKIELELSEADLQDWLEHKFKIDADLYHKAKDIILTHKHLEESKA